MKRFTEILTDEDARVTANLAECEHCHGKHADLGFRFRQDLMPDAGTFTFSAVCPRTGSEILAHRDLLDVLVLDPASERRKVA